MFKTLRLIIVILACWLFLTTFCVITFYANGYPDEWDHVVPGMSSEQVLDLCGTPFRQQWGEKGHFFRDFYSWGGWELRIYPGVDGHVRETTVRVCYDPDCKYWDDWIENGSLWEGVRLHWLGF
ncbi:MAG: hypothetical protein JEY79_06795 [Pseudodesulfovibrio sp.]|nr:hypothetical protein [Pseudodesulfovibrio sp.]